MKYLVFLFALAVGAQSFPPSSSGNAKSIMGKPICASVMTATDGQALTWSTSSACWVVSTPSGSGNMVNTGASAVSNVPRYTSTAGTALAPSPVTIDASGNVYVPGILTVGDGTVAGSSSMAELAANGTNFRKWLVPDALTADLTLLFPNSVPTAGQVMLFSAPSSDVSTISWGTPVLSGGALGTPTSGTLTNATGLPTAGLVDGAVTQVKASADLKRIGLGVAVGDPAGSALATGVLGYIVAPKACTIVGWDILVDAGTATVDVWKVASGTAIPTDAASITASAVPAIASGTALHSTTLTGWTTSVAAYDRIGFNLDAVATAKFINITLFCE